MLISFIIAAVFLAAQKPQPATEPQKTAETGIIAGRVAPPPEQRISGPVQVILLPPRYTNLWNSDVQKRLDNYWERYKPAFATQKEYFFEVSRMAQKESIDYIVTRMRRDPSSNAADFIKETSPEGKFEFKNVPFGEYKILALGKVGDQSVIWQDTVDVQSPIPQFLELKKRLP